MAYKDKAKKTAYQNEFIKQAYDRINLTVPKGRKDEIQAAAEAQGQSVNSFINHAIDRAMEQQAGTVEPPTEAEAQARVVVVSPGAVPGANICSRFISQWGPDFQSALDASGQTAEDYIKQAVAERVKRETRPPTPEWIKKLFPNERWPVIHVERDLPPYERRQLQRHFTEEQKDEWEKEFRLEMDEETTEAKKNCTGFFATPPSCNLDI